jgi:predicted nucleic acid-binding protein
MADLPFLDANVILRHALQDLPDQSARATAFIRRIEAGAQQVRTTDTVIFEVAFVLERTYKVPRPDIRDVLAPIIALPGVLLRGKRRYRRVFELYLAYPKLSFADCSHVAVMESLGLADLVSFDRGFDQLPTITRKEPDTDGSLP